MAYGAIKHRKRKSAYLRHKISSRNMKVTVRLTRYAPGGRVTQYRAKACFFPGWKGGEDYRRAGPGGTVVPLYARRRRLSERCGESGWESGPTKAVTRALRALAAKKL